MDASIEPVEPSYDWLEGSASQRDRLHLEWIWTTRHLEYPQVHILFNENYHTPNLFFNAY